MTPKTFRSAKNPVSCGILLFISFALIVTGFFPKGEFGIALVIVDAMIFVPAAMMLWIVFDTKYIITNEVLKWRSGPFNGKINVSSIRNVVYDSSFIKYQTWKPGLDQRGLVVNYNKFDDIFISPKDREAFISELLLINDGIEIVKP